MNKPVIHPPEENDSKLSESSGARTEVGDIRVGGPAQSTDARRGIVGVAAAFLTVVALVMLIGQWRQEADEPWRSQELAAARARLIADPKNEALKIPVRELDRQLRLRYFRSLERNRSGAWLLLAGGIGLVVVARLWYAPARSSRPWVAPARYETQRRAVQTLLGIAGVAGFSMALVGWGFRVGLPERPVEVAAGVKSDREAGGTRPEMTVVTSMAEWGLQWPRFRGVGGDGRVDARPIPERWNLATGQGVVWKTALPLKGYSSPVVWKDRVFVTGGNREQRLVFAFDGKTGLEVWRRPVTPTNAPAPALEPPDQSGQAASSPATDGERVYAIFATGELGALDFEGRLVWSHRLDFSENGYGHASSLVIWNDALFVQADQGTEEDGKSALHAYDTRTGKVLWTTKRPVGGSWTTPVVFESAGRWQVVTAGDPWLMAHDPGTGRELWRAKVLGGELAPSPVFGDGKIVATSPGHAMSALKVDRDGDISQSGLIWRIESEVPDVPSPTVVGDLLFTANTEGHLYCREWASGVKVWEHAFEVEIQASPLVVGDRIYLFGQPGNVWVIRVGRTFEMISEFEMGEEVYATPAIAGNRIYIRTDRHLLCIGEAESGVNGGTSDGR